MNIKSCALCILFLFSLVKTSYSWGAEGHMTTASVATALLDDSAKKAITDILPSGSSLRSVATWADDVRRTSAYRWSAPLHFLNTPDQKCTYDYNRDCISGDKPGFCVAGAIQNFTSHLQSYKPGSNTSALQDSLKFLVHFMGDIHQPLHTGFKGDKGGNSIDVRFLNKKTNLHSTWDTYIINELLEEDYGGSDIKWKNDIIRNVSPGGQYYEQAMEWAKCSQNTLDCINPMATEGIELACKFAYECKAQGSAPCQSEGVITDPDLGMDYYNRTKTIVNYRIAQGGVRLAAFLNTVFRA